MNHTVELRSENDRFALSTYVGTRLQMPDSAALRTACKIGRMQAYSNEDNAALRWPFAANLNNLAVALVLEREWSAAEETIREALENFKAASDLFGKPVPAAYVGIAVARYNLAYLCLQISNWPGLRDEVASARAYLGAFHINEWDEDFFFVDSALENLNTLG